MSASPSTKGATRIRGIFGFFVGIFGAMAILGMFFKILKWDNYEMFMLIGFIGEAAAFVVMGVFELVGAFTAKTQDEAASPAPAAKETAPAIAPVEVSATFRRMLDEQVSDDLNTIMTALSREVQRLGTEIREVGGELERARHAMSNMRRELDRVATGDLAGDTERLGEGMYKLGTEMSQAGTAVEQMRADLEMMAQRFRHFNEPATQSPEWGQAKLMRLP